MPDDQSPPEKSPCDREFDLYEGYRADVLPVEREAEKSFDTFLGTISVAAIGSSFTLLNDASKGDGKGFVITSWVFFTLCLMMSLADRLLTYHVYKRGREIYDEEFAKWTEGAFNRSTEAAQKLWQNLILRYSKIVAMVLFGAGLVALLIGVAMGWSDKSTPPPTPSPAVVNNIYNVPSTQPTTQQVKP